MGTPNVLADAVLVTTSTTGTGTYALGSAVTGHFHPSDHSLNGARVSYTVLDSLTSPTIREVGEGVLASGSPWTLTRATIRRSLTGGVAGSSAINWAAGTKYIFLTPIAANSPQYDTAGELRIAAGTNALPGLYPTGDNDTGLFSPGANLLAVAVGGTEVARFSSAGVSSATNAKAWVNFNGSDGSINSSFNVSSVTRVSTGLYVVNFATATANANYAVVGTAGDAASGNLYVQIPGAGSNTTSGCSVRTVNASGTVVDASLVNVIVMGA